MVQYFAHDLFVRFSCSPGVTGYWLDHKDHLDGGFTLLQHPKCSKTVHLPLNNADLWLNSLNVNMAKEKAYRLWNDGLAYGL